MVKIFDPQALSDPGPNSASAGLSSMVANLLNQQNNQANNKNDLFKSLLSARSGLSQQFLQNKGALERQNVSDVAALERTNASLFNPDNLIGMGAKLLKAADDLEISGQPGAAEQAASMRAKANQINNFAFGGQQPPATEGITPSIAPPTQTSDFTNVVPTARQGGLTSEELNLPEDPFTRPAPESKTFSQATVGALPGINLNVAGKQADVVSGTAGAIKAQAEIDPILKRQKERESDVVINGRTGEVASQPTFPGSTERQPIKFNNQILESQEGIRNPDGSLSESGKKIEVGVSKMRSQGHSSITIITKILKLDQELQLNQVQRFALSIGSVDTVPGLDPSQKLKAAILKTYFNQLEEIKLRNAAEANEGRPTDKDFDKISIGYPTIDSSREKLIATSIFKLAQISGILAERDIQLNNTGTFNKEVDDFQKFSNQTFEFGVPADINPDDYETILQRIIGNSAQSKPAPAAQPAAQPNGQERVQQKIDERSQQQNSQSQRAALKQFLQGG